MTIKVFSIEKVKKDNYYDIISSYKKMISRYSNIEDIPLFNKQIAISQNISQRDAQKSYTDIFLKRMGKYNIVLDPLGKEIDSFVFSRLFEDKSEISFFIGGAYGFEKEFVKKNDLVISLSRLTMSHKIAKIVLYEQIYRAFSIMNNHPYHK